MNQEQIENQVLLSLVNRMNMLMARRKAESCNKYFKNTLQELCFEFREAENPHNRHAQNDAVLY